MENSEQTETKILHDHHMKLRIIIANIKETQDKQIRVPGNKEGGWLMAKAKNNFGDRYDRLSTLQVDAVYFDELEPGATIITKRIGQSFCTSPNL